ncbi:hypothetical protein B0H14DRAFT_3460828 [Mycena olivaceomarginata]|nr:hypothetical protein B0H14DRAFT_3460828 [Mycena olivaceomarginata]
MVKTQKHREALTSLLLSTHSSLLAVEILRYVDHANQKVPRDERLYRFYALVDLRANFLARLFSEIPDLRVQMMSPTSRHSDQLVNALPPPPDILTRRTLPTLLHRARPHRPARPRAFRGAVPRVGHPHPGSRRVARAPQLSTPPPTTPSGGTWVTSSPFAPALRRLRSPERMTRVATRPYPSHYLHTRYPHKIAGAAGAIIVYFRNLVTQQYCLGIPNFKVDAELVESCETQFACGFHNNSWTR